MKTTTKKNPVRCMINKDKAAYMDRLYSRRNVLKEAISTYDCSDSVKPYDILYDDFMIGSSSAVAKIRALKAVLNCGQPPFQGKCRNVLLCDACLASWRYKIYKRLCNAIEFEDQKSIVHYRHNYIVPRGIALSYERASDTDGTAAHPIARYMLIDGFNNPTDRHYTYQFLGTQQAPNHVYSCFTDGLNVELQAKEQNYNDMYSIYNEVLLKLPGTLHRGMFYDTTRMWSSIQSYIRYERLMLLNMSEITGITTRVSFRLTNDNNLLCFSTDAVVTLPTRFGELCDSRLSSLMHNDTYTADRGSHHFSYEYKVPFVTDSDMYVSNGISLYYMDVDDNEWLSTHNMNIMKFLERAFPYNATVDNMTPMELILCQCVLDSMADTSIGGLLRN